MLVLVTVMFRSIHFPASNNLASKVICLKFVPLQPSVFDQHLRPTQQRVAEREDIRDAEETGKPMMVTKIHLTQYTYPPSLQGIMKMNIRIIIIITDCTVLSFILYITLEVLFWCN